MIRVAARSEAFQNGDRFALLLDKRASDIPYADAAEHKNQQSRKRKIILRPGELLARDSPASRGRIEPSMVVPFNASRSCRDKFGRVVGRAVKNPPPDAAAFRVMPAVVERCFFDKHPRPEPKTARAAGFLIERRADL